MTILEKVAIKNYLKEVFEGDNNNVVVETYNEYRWDNTNDDDRDNFKLLPNNEDTLNIILKDNEYLEWIFNELPQEEFEQWYGNV